jgi:hypothetical protein
LEDAGRAGKTVEPEQAGRSGDNIPQPDLYQSLKTTNITAF